MVLLNSGVDFRVTEHKVDNNKNIRLKIWDTSGQERFRSIAESFYKGAHGVCLVFDLNNQESFDKIQFWVKSIKEKSENTDIEKILIGNKTDLVQIVNEQDINQLCTNNQLKYFRTSAKNGEGLQLVFDYMANKTYQTYGHKQKQQNHEQKKQKNGQVKETTSTSVLSNKNKKKNESNDKCC